jgi:uncharacterized Zn finger protein
VKITVYSDCPICNSDNKSEVDLAQETERSFDRHRLIHCIECGSDYSIKLDITATVKIFKVVYQEVKP